ncbi:MAG: glycosyltransferase family 4 protein [Verrucomicrobiota bacterium JB022]|nr:glycosyltransferase family 4 protein [Verrucomicrobiota bacterium JB022]
MSTPRAVLVCNQGWHLEAPSGANRLGSDVARALAAEGAEVHYLCVSPAGPYDQPVESEGVQVWRHPPAPAKAKGWARLQHHLRESERLARCIYGQTRIDLVYGHTPLQYAGALRPLRARKRPRLAYAVHSPYALEMRYNDEAHEPRSWMRAVRQGMFRLIERQVLQKSDFVHGFSAYTGKCLRELYGPRLCAGYEAWPAWADLEHFQPRHDFDLANFLGGPPLEPGERVFFTLRRLQPRMGLENLIEAAARLAQEGHKFRLLIGGSGPLRSALEDQAALHDLRARVRFLGRLDDADIPRLYTAADCFILPTRGLECFGLIVLEAWACGTPVIATPVGAIPELFDDPEWRGWLTRDASAEALTERMRAFLQEPPASSPEPYRERSRLWDKNKRLGELLERLKRA